MTQPTNEKAMVVEDDSSRHLDDLPEGQRVPQYGTSLPATGGSFTAEEREAARQIYSPAAPRALPADDVGEKLRALAEYIEPNDCDEQQEAYGRRASKMKEAATVMRQAADQNARLTAALAEANLHIETLTDFAEDVADANNAKALLAAARERDSLAAKLATIRAETVEAAAKAICPLCHDGVRIETEITHSDFRGYHDLGVASDGKHDYENCAAAPIRSLTGGEHAG